MMKQQRVTGEKKQIEEQLELIYQPKATIVGYLGRIQGQEHLKNFVCKSVSIKKKFHRLKFIEKKRILNQRIQYLLQDFLNKPQSIKQLMQLSMQLNCSYFEQSNGNHKYLNKIARWIRNIER